MMASKPKIVVFCGSSRFVDLMAVCMWLVERDEGAICLGLHLLPQWYPDLHADHQAEREGAAKAMDELHIEKIDLAHEIFVVNYDHYIGESTRREISYAQVQGKPLRWFTHDPVGERVRAMLEKTVVSNHERSESMSEWQKYRKTAVQEMRSYVPGEDLTGISVSPQDMPGPGGMIARNASNPVDQWYVAADFFQTNYELVG